MEIRPGIHQIPGLKWSNAFLLVEDNGLTLIDGGLPGDGSKVLNYISRLGHAPQTCSASSSPTAIRTIPDHSGPMKELSWLSGASITIHWSDTRHRAKRWRWWGEPGLERAVRYVCLAVSTPLGAGPFVSPERTRAV